MIPEWLVNAAGVGQTATVLISLTAYVPQWAKLRRTRSSEDLSLRAWWLWALSYSLSAVYAVVQLLVNGHGWPLVISTSAGVLFVFITLALVLWYRARGRGRFAGHS